MSKHHGGFKRYAATGIAGATLAMSLLLPATALANPITVGLNDNQLALQANLSKNWQSTKQEAENSNKAFQGSSVDQSQPNILKPQADLGAYQKADLQPESQAQIDNYSGDAKAYGPSTIIGISNWQDANASANGNADAMIHTGSANGYTGNANANGGWIDQQNEPKTGNGGDAKSIAGSATIDPASANGGNNGGGKGGSNGGGGMDKSSSWVPPTGGDPANGGAATSNGSSSATANSTGGASGSNNGANSNWASANGGSADNMAYGGNSGYNSATAVVAGGTAVNALSVSANTQGNATATSGNASNTGAATSSATANNTQTSSPSNTQTLNNYPTQTSSVAQKLLQNAQSKQSSENEVKQSNSATSMPH